MDELTFIDVESVKCEMPYWTFEVGYLLSDYEIWYLIQQYSFSMN
jgi:hypothetical protein